MTLPTQPDKRHVAQAKHNNDLLDESCFPDPRSGKPSRYKDWIGTVAFYVALHYVEAYLCANGWRWIFVGHRERNDYLKRVVSVRDRKIGKILPKYLGLYKYSTLTRYRPCFYHYVRLNDLSSHYKFALEDLPKALKLP